MYSQYTHTTYNSKGRLWLRNDGCNFPYFEVCSPSVAVEDVRVQFLGTSQKISYLNHGYLSVTNVYHVWLTYFLTITFWELPEMVPILFHCCIRRHSHHYMMMVLLVQTIITGFLLHTPPLSLACLVNGYFFFSFANWGNGSGSFTRVWFGWGRVVGGCCLLVEHPWK
jgi:hypothetical protein